MRGKYSQSLYIYCEINKLIASLCIVDKLGINKGVRMELEWIN
jgi:hypothetical protein